MSKSSWTVLRLGPKTEVKVDREDLARIQKHSWRVTRGSQGRARIVTSIRTEKGVRSLTLGRFLMKPPAGKQVYPRRFNDGLDYRKENLIVCTLKERQRLLPKIRKGATSNYRGVSLQKSTQKWRAAIQVKGRSINLGDFKSEEDAARAYNVAAKKHFGPMAYQNRLDKKKLRRR